MLTLEGETTLEIYELYIRILENERMKITRRGRLSDVEDQRLFEIDTEIQIYQGMINQLYS
jgi:hypothetical protein